LKINLKSAKPIYQQIVEGIHSAIASGIYKAGERIPSARDMAIRLKVNPNTVQKAYEELTRSGVLTSLGNKGKVVAKRGEPSATRHSEQAIEDAFRAGVELAIASGLDKERIQEILDRVFKSFKGRAVG